MVMSVDEARGDEAIRRVDDLYLDMCRRRDFRAHPVNNSIFDEDVAVLENTYAAINRDDRRVSEQKRRHYLQI